MQPILSISRTFWRQIFKHCINRGMNPLYDQTQEAYADLCTNFDADFIFTLNVQSENPSEEFLSDLIAKLFYKLECNEHGYEKRSRKRKVCSIERIVAIENASKRHAHVLVKSYGGHDADAIMDRIAKVWFELNRTPYDLSSEYLINRTDFIVRDRRAVSAYITKDVAKELRNGNDVIDMKSSFIRKHSYN